jgi:hypothetical protein
VVGWGKVAHHKFKFFIIDFMYLKWSEFTFMKFESITEY